MERARARQTRETWKRGDVTELTTTLKKKKKNEARIELLKTRPEDDGDQMRDRQTVRDFRDASPSTPTPVTPHSARSKAVLLMPWSQAIDGADRRLTHLSLSSVSRRPFVLVLFLVSPGSQLQLAGAQPPTVTRRDFSSRDIGIGWGGGAGGVGLWCGMPWDAVTGY